MHYIACTSQNMSSRHLWNHGILSNILAALIELHKWDIMVLYK